MPLNHLVINDRWYFQGSRWVNTSRLTNLESMTAEQGQVAIRARPGIGDRPLCGCRRVGYPGGHGCDHQGHESRERRRGIGESDELALS